MKKILFSVFTLISIGMFAQKLDVRWSPLLEPGVGKSQHFIPLGQSDEGSIVGTISNSKGTITELVKIDSDLNNHVKIKVDFEEEITEASFILRGRVVVFTSKTEGNYKTIYARFAEGNNLGEPRVIIKNSIKGGKFHFSASPNGKYLGIIADAPYLKGKNEEILTWILDDQLNEKMFYKFALTNKNMKVKINVPVMSDSGVLYIIKRFKNGSDNNYYVFSINEASERHQRKTLTLMGKRIADLVYALDYSNHLRIAGFYSSHSYNVYEGDFYFELDNTTKAVQFQQNSFDGSFLIEAEGKKNYKKYGGLMNFKINEMLLLDDHVYFTANHQKRIKLDEGKGETMHYVKNKMVVICLKKNGEPSFYKTITLNQESTGDYGFWNQNKMLVLGDTLSVLTNHKVNGKIVLKQTTISKDKSVQTVELSDIFVSEEQQMGIDLKNIKALKDGFIAPGWNNQRNKATIGLISTSAKE